MNSFEEVFASIKDDPNVLGFILQGSRGKGFENASSDYDARVIVKDEIAEEYKKKFDIPFKNMDLPVDSLSEFKEYAKWGSLEAVGERYDFTHCRILIDRTGEIQKLVEEKGRIPEEVRYYFVYNSLDAYVNAVFRSVKAWKNKNPEGAHFEAAASIPYFLDALFGVYSRPRPYSAYLNEELGKSHLEELPWDTKKLVQTLLAILKTGDLKTQQKLLKESERFFREKGFGKMFDAWEGKDTWAMEVRL
ncbi:MAG: hypothetical protein HY471_01135 [Candidatus Sungbacteria bacterium]|nr:hypothetical protein [Candidatus Sungbacteria bacterium]